MASSTSGPEVREPIPGDASTEPVATAQQSHVNGRVGPPTIAQDAAADWHAPEGVEQIEPGAVLPAATPFDGGPVLISDDPADTEQGGGTTGQGGGTQKSGPVTSTSGPGR